MPIDTPTPTLAAYWDMLANQHWHMPGYAHLGFVVRAREDLEQLWLIGHSAGRHAHRRLYNAFCTWAETPGASLADRPPRPAEPWLVTAHWHDEGTYSDVVMATSIEDAERALHLKMWNEMCVVTDDEEAYPDPDGESFNEADFDDRRADWDIIDCIPVREHIRHVQSLADHLEFEQLAAAEEAINGETA